MKQTQGPVISSGPYIDKYFIYENFNEEKEGPIAFAKSALRLKHLRKQLYEILGAGISALADRIREIRSVVGKILEIKTVFTRIDKANAESGFSPHESILNFSDRLKALHGNV